MTFLQPSLLWLLAFAALPVVIHLLNRMRFRTVRWAATKFLFSANRASNRRARLRQLLLLACRVLALVAMVLAIARPLAGGWAGWMLSTSPDVVLILLDRSASMEDRDPRSGATRREEALAQLGNAAAVYGSRTRCVLIESVFKTPQEIAQPALLSKLPGLGPSDTAADMPGLFEAASAWLGRNHTGLAEIWIASDLQHSNWQPDSPRWHTLSAQLAALPGTVRVRLLDLSGRSAPDASITLAGATRPPHAASLDLAFDVQRFDTSTASIPATLFLDGARSHLDLATDGAITRIHHSVALDPAHDFGYGSIELPPDGNDHDNAAYFVYNSPPALHAAVIGPDDESRRCLVAAADPFPGDPKFSCDAFDTPPANVDWSKYALVAWDAPLPSGTIADSLQRYVNAGGALIFFPSTQANNSAFAGASFGQPVAAGTGQAFRVIHWDERDGPLADAQSGTPLALNTLGIMHAAAIVSGGDVVAAFGDNRPFLTGRVSGAGRLYFCATLPRTDWSSLGDGRVLVPMLQRILQQGAVRFSAGSFLEAGDPSLIEDSASWISLDAPNKDVRTQAGVYRNGARLIAVNRPAREDDPDRVNPAAARALFAPLPAFLFESAGTNPESLQGEIWRGLLFAMLIFLVGESYLSLPPAQIPGASSSASTSKKPRTPAMAGARA